MKRRTHRTDRPARSLTLGDQFVEFWLTLPSPDDPLTTLKIDDFEIAFLKAILDPHHIHPRERVSVRTVRQAVLTMGRKNGKTTIAGALTLGFLVGPMARYNQQLYSVAFEREQAAIVYNTCASMVHADEELSSYIRCIDTPKKLKCALNQSRFQSLSAEYRSKHGLNPGFVIFDELAQFNTDRKLFDTMLTSMGAQLEPLMLTISTQAASNEAILSQLIDYGREVNAGRIDDPSFVLHEYSTPTDDELALVGKTIWDEDTWYMSNPALSTFRSLDEMREMAKKARNMPSLELTFRNLYLNQRIAAHALLVTPVVWDQCKGTLDDEEELTTAEAIVAIDLSSRRDLTAIVVVFKLSDGRFVAKTFAFTPDASLEERSKRDRAPYIDWVKRGFMIATPGASISYEYVAKFLVDEIMSKYRGIKAIVYDRWRFEQFKKCILDEDPSFDEEMLKPFGQGYKDMSPAIDSLEDVLLNGLLLHGGHPVLRYAFSNAVVEKDPAGNRKLTKAKSYGRIDPAIALVMAVGSFYSTEDSSTPGITSV